MSINNIETLPKRTYKVVVAAKISAPAEKIYRVFSDYRDEHKRILPPEHFVNYKVEKGGQGAGTVVSVQVKVMGSTIPFRLEVTEPDPGRLLIEKDASSGVATSFSLTPLNENQTKVEIETIFPQKAGLAGYIEKMSSPLTTAGIYRKELKRLAAHLGVNIELN